MNHVHNSGAITSDMLEHNSILISAFLVKLVLGESIKEVLSCHLCFLRLRSVGVSSEVDEGAWCVLHEIFSMDANKMPWTWLVIFLTNPNLPAFVFP